MVAYGLHIRPLVDNQARINFYGPGGELVAWIRGSKANIPVSNHLSSTQLVLGPTQQNALRLRPLRMRDGAEY